jgi:N utilization substance protein A
VASTKRDVDPIGACVGLRGTRIQVISRELRGEKIDIIEWSHDPATFVARALSPAKVSAVTIGEPDPEGQSAAFVVVPDNQLSLAIGKKGQNARLAAKLTGMRIDIKSESELETERDQPVSPPAGIAELRGMTQEALEALRSAGLDSPAAIVGAGRERVAELVTGSGQADEVFAAAQESLAARGASPAIAAGEPAPAPGPEEP